MKTFVKNHSDVILLPNRSDKHQKNYVKIYQNIKILKQDSIKNISHIGHIDNKVTLLELFR